MAEFSVRSDAVDVEQIMRQIRARIREKRGADYTEGELQQLASVKLEKFLDPKGLRSNLVEQFRKHRVVSEAPPNYAFEDTTLYETHRGLLRTMRRLLNPLLKLFFNPNKISNALHIQARVNEEFHRRFRQREEMDPLYYEVIHNLVLEVTRLGIEVHNLTMRVESVSSRLDFDERRGRALESVVQYRAPQKARTERTPAPPAAGAPHAAAADAAAAAAAGGTDEDDDGDDAPQEAGGAAQPGGRTDGRPDGSGGGGDRKRRRRRRRRRPGFTQGDRPGGEASHGGNGVQSNGGSSASPREDGAPSTPGVPRPTDGGSGASNQ